MKKITLVIAVNFLFGDINDSHNQTGDKKFILKYWFEFAKSFMVLISVLFCYKKKTHKYQLLGTKGI